MKKYPVIRRFGGIIDVHSDGDIFVNNGKGKFYYVGFLCHEDDKYKNSAKHNISEDFCTALKKVLPEEDLT
jgi:hypothetical protein